MPDGKFPTSLLYRVLGARCAHAKSSRWNLRSWSRAHPSWKPIRHEQHFSRQITSRFTSARAGHTQITLRLLCNLNPLGDVAWATPNPPKHIEEPFVFAISPDGQHIAEGGNGKVRLYRIEP